MKIRKSKPSIFIFAILVAFLAAFLGLVSCSSSTTSTTPNTGATSSVTSVTLKYGGADAGNRITKATTEAAFTLTADVVVVDGVATTVTWSSSDTSVATVADGVVTIVAAGSTTITAESTVDATKKDSIALTVEVPAVSSVALRYGNADAGEDIAKTTTDTAFTLTAEVAVTGGAATTVRWDSSDTTVATVDANTGLVNIQGVGMTLITGTSTHNSAKSDTVLITVTQALQ